MTRLRHVMHASLFLLLPFIPTTLFPQSQWSYSLSGGAIFSHPQISAGGVNRSLTIPGEFVWNLGLGYRFTEVTSVHANFDYAHFSPVLKESSVRIVTYRLNYLDIGFAGRASFLRGIVQPFVEAGPNFSIKLNEGKEWAPQVTHIAVVGEDFSSAYFSMMLGAGISFDLWEKVGLNVEGRYYRAFSDAGKISGWRWSHTILLIGIQAGG